MVLGPGISFAGEATQESFRPIMMGIRWPNRQVAIACAGDNGLVLQQLEGLWFEVGKAYLRQIVSCLPRLLGISRPVFLASMPPAQG